jgi:tetratricopeptide (TPR) repeat protein/predicted Ser/Thr protein kinase
LIKEMPERPRDDSPDPDRSAPELGPSPTLDDVENGADHTDGDPDSNERALAALGVEARAELERLRARLGLLDDQEPSLPSAVGRYRLLDRIGHGGMGVVYRAHDPELGREVAIKLVHAPPFATADKLRTRLLREAKVLAKLAHPNVVRVYDCGHHDDEVYLAMEYVEGKTLRSWQGAPERTRAELLDAYVAAGTGLAAVHDVGIVHRDFKPDNVLVADDGRILVGDFGLAVGEVADERAAVIDDAERIGLSLPASITKTGALLGTVLYMAPEQLRGDPATASSDQFAFCVTLWEALTGARPFRGEDQATLLAEIEKGRPLGGERLGGKLRRALERGLAFEPAARFPELRALVEAIRRKRGPSMPAALALVGVSVGAGLLLSRLVCSAAPLVEECALERAVVEVREGEAWAGVRQRLGEAGMGTGPDRLDAHLRRLEQQALALCERSTGAGDEARRQHLQSWVDGLRGFLETAEGRTVAELLEELEAFDHARLTAPPPRVLDRAVVQARDDSWAHERRGELDAALEAAERAVALAGERKLELAVAQQRRGRVLAVLGRYDEAMAAYGAAISGAEAASYDDARLETRLLAARTAIMRLEQLERGQDALDEVEGLLERLDEPWPSLRRAAHHELNASLLMRRERPGRALADQWLAILQLTLLGNVYETGVAYVNLGNFYERRALTPDSSPGDLEQSRASYEHALELLAPTQPSPAWALAAYNLGHWLASNGGADERDRAERLLYGVKGRDDDVRIPALTSLVLMKVQRDQASAAHELARELRLVLTRTPPSSASVGFDAWTIAATAFAFAGDLQALDGALVEAYASAAALERSGTRSAELVIDLARVDLTVASLLTDIEPARSQALAHSARERLLTLPVHDRPIDLMGEIDRRTAEASP